MPSVTKPRPAPPLLKPPALRPGDRVGVIAPASYFKRELFDQGIAALRRKGYEPVFLDTIFDRDLYFAGSAERRARELEQMFSRDDVRALVCVRGGYGANYLLPHIDCDLIRKHPKIFCGYSDITCLLTWFHDAAGLVTFHGPMITGDFVRQHGINEMSWLAATGGNADWELASHQLFGFNAMIPGFGEGVLYGGCLSILVASLGTPYEAQTEGKLLFLEDIGAKPYQIDRMLMQLKYAGKFRDVKGIVLGEMMDCIQSPEQPYTLQEVVERIVGELNVPVAYGLRSGHVSRENATLPFGVRARLTVTTETVRLEFLESAVAKAHDLK
ncbi:MAG TPA: LD-carboxypeptidase [Terriglobales bacterium]|nr:LD-carboxypeptidase [Terriglobales bacterium]